MNLVEPLPTLIDPPRWVELTPGTWIRSSTIVAVHQHEDDPDKCTAYQDDAGAWDAAMPAAELVELLAGGRR